MYIIPKEITNKIGREIFMPRQKWQRELEEAIDSFSPGDALEAVRIEVRLEEAKWWNPLVHKHLYPDVANERIAMLESARAKLSENAGSKP